MSMDRDDQLRQGLADLADGAGWTDLQDRVLRASNRLAWRRRVMTSAAAVAVFAAVAVPVALARPDHSDRGGPVAGPPPSSSPSASTSPSASASTNSSPSSSPTRSTTSGPPEETGCPVSAKTLFAATQGAYVGGVDVGQPTGVSNVVCYRRYATAKPVPAVGATHILFGYQLPERRWIALNAGPKGMCGSFVLDGSTSARLPGC
jgi:hypothetical protein